MKRGTRRKWGNDLSLRGSVKIYFLKGEQNLKISPNKGVRGSSLLIKRGKKTGDEGKKQKKCRQKSPLPLGPRRLKMAIPKKGERGWRLSD